MRFTTIFTTLAVATGGLAAPTPSQLDARAVVNHDSLNPISSRLQGGAIGRAIQMFTPLLHIAHGCQPYTAVDDSGNTRFVQEPMYCRLIQDLTVLPVVVVSKTVAILAPDVEIATRDRSTPAQPGTEEGLP